MREVDRALTCTAPPDTKLLLSTSAFTSLLLSASSAVRPRKFSAKAAPPAALPPPATEPANDWMTALSCACTRSEAEATACVTLSIWASTVEVMALVVLEPARAVVPAPDTPAATERMVPDEVAPTSTAPVARMVWFFTRAVTVPPISFTDTAAPTAAVPAPLMVPAKDEMAAWLSACTVKAPPEPAWLPPSTSATTSASITLVVTLPLMAAVPAPLPEAATDWMDPLRSASSDTAMGAVNVALVNSAETLKSPLPWPMRLTATAPPMAPVPPADTAPASDSMAPDCEACTESAVAVPVRWLSATQARVLPLSTLALDEPARA